MSKVHVLLTGPPGVGKTTLVKKVVDALRSDGLTVRGFYTEEVRKDGLRIGFDVVTVDGQRATLSRATSDNMAGPHSRQHQIGKYVVDVKSFEDISLRALEAPVGQSCNEKVVMVVDEVGKMEVLSKPFRVATLGLFSQANCIVLATVPVNRGIPLVQSLVARRDTAVYEVSRQNRDSLVVELVSVLKAHMSKS